MTDLSELNHDPANQSSRDLAYRQAMAAFYGGQDATQKLENFSKYVPRQAIARFLARYELFRLVQDVHGSIVECGVLTGGGLMSFATVSVTLEPYNFQRQVIGFDTFSGFSSVSDQDWEGAAQKSPYLRDGGLGVDGAYDELRQAIALFDQNRFLNQFAKVELVRGDFGVTGPQYLKDNPHLIVSLLYLDFDIYAPTKAALELFLPRIPKGGVIAFDELNERTFPGETMAVQEVVGLSGLRLRRFPFEPGISYAVVE